LMGCKYLFILSQCLILLIFIKFDIKVDEKIKNFNIVSNIIYLGV